MTKRPVHCVSPQKTTVQLTSEDHHLAHRTLECQPTCVPLSGRPDPKEALPVARTTAEAQGVGQGTSPPPQPVRAKEWVTEALGK